MGGGGVGAVPAPLTFLTLGVFQAEAGLVALGHLSAVGGQDVIVGEDVHAVVVPEGDRVRPIFWPAPCRPAPSEAALPLTALSPVTLMPHPGVAPRLGPEVRSPQVVDLGGEA